LIFKVAVSSGFNALCVLVFLTDPSKCCIETSASDECFAASSGVEYFARYSCSTRETAVLTTAETSAPLNPSVVSAILLNPHFDQWVYLFSTTILRYKK
jgi:hypothetical protein